TNEKIDYLKDVKPILDKRCVTCHSCYNSPCQAKMSSFEGVDRGASKIMVYDAMRLRAISPTRLFIDAKDTSSWREKGFYSVTGSSDLNGSYNDSIMIQLLHDKKKNPELIGEYAPETDEWICPRNSEELGEYFEEKPNHGMPYGFPAIEDSQYNTLSQWLLQGANGPTQEEQIALKKPSKSAQVEIEKFENFFNQSDAKHKVTARYLYEHLYLAHIYFPNAKGEFYELVRSYTPPGYPIEIIPTTRVFDNPNVQTFYYRLSKIHSTIVHKTHLTFKFDDGVLARFNELFIKPKWTSLPKVLEYNDTVSSNPLKAYEQIPAPSRYQFLLDNSHYIIMNFIRGPVCRGQMALNVIHDHFWVMFKDPKHDITVTSPEFLKKQYYNLELPIASVSERVFSAFSDEYKNRYANYFIAKEASDKGKASIDGIWKGEKPADAPILSVYRHFDSASVHKGVLGSEPRTMWVIDFAQLERIYYTLVAGYDVFGNIAHQTKIRRYMDFLRLEGELNFIEFMPKTVRYPMLESWYIGDGEIEATKDLAILSKENLMNYLTENPKNEFITRLIDKHILKSTKIGFDYMNYKKPGEDKPQMPKEFHSYKDYQQAARSITMAGSGFITYMTDKYANNIFLRIKLQDGSYKTSYLIINRWHDNVSSLFNGDEVLDSSKDTMDILNISAGSYPNVFVDVDIENLEDFLDLMKNMKGQESDFVRLKKYFISRSNPKFWEIFDWFGAHEYRVDPLNAGLLDLNRYARTVWKSE
ncbi:MAG: fatty acid cis/trans isomerase, partial [Campylobacterota bacterium]|nr:fatty acid cis/trans isomerase [Campylobacterota bacterium]